MSNKQKKIFSFNNKNANKNTFKAVNFKCRNEIFSLKIKFYILRTFEIVILNMKLCCEIQLGNR